jgi:hypothetical protein
LLYATNRITLVPHRSLRSAIRTKGSSMYGARISGVAVVAVTIIALASLAGRITDSHAASQQTTVAPVLAGFATGMLDAVVGGIRDEAIAAGSESMLSFIGRARST